MLETAKQLNYVELEQQRDVSTVQLLREMDTAADAAYRQALFEQAADQEASHISEVLEGAVVTDFTFDTRDGRLYLLQPNGVTDWLKMHELGVERAEARAAADPNFAPYVEIAKAELREARLQEEMIRRGEPTVMLKLSLCGNDVMGAQQLEQIGRDPYQQRAYVRTSVFDGQKLHIHSRSIDGVSLPDGREGINSGWGAIVPSGVEMPADASSIDILNAELTFDGSEMGITEMHDLVDRCVAAFDDLQFRRTGRRYKAGRSPEGIDTYGFVLDNRDLLSAHLDSLIMLARQDMPLGALAAQANELRYDIMSSYKRRLEGTWVDMGSLGESVAHAGSVERALGTKYSGCDTVIGQTANPANAGYSNADRASIADSLRREVKGKGACQACGAQGALFGCGIYCGRCNDIWCNEFARSGKQLGPDKLGQMVGRRNENSLLDSFFYGVTEYIQQVSEEDKQKRRLQKIKEDQLAEAA